MKAAALLPEVTTLPELRGKETVGVAVGVNEPVPDGVYEPVAVAMVVTFPVNVAVAR